MGQDETRFEPKSQAQRVKIYYYVQVGLECNHQAVLHLNGEAEILIQLQFKSVKLKFDD